MRNGYFHYFHTVTILMKQYLKCDNAFRLNMIMLMAIGKYNDVEWSSCDRKMHFFILLEIISRFILYVYVLHKITYW